MTPQDPPSDSASAPEYPTSGAATEPHHTFVGTGWFWTLILGCVVALATIIFMAQNAASARVNFLWTHSSLPLAVLVLAGVLAGVVIDELAGVVYRRSRRRRLTERQELQHLRRQ